MIRSFSHCLYLAAKDMIDHDGVEHAGYLAFLGLLAFFPFLVFLVALAGVFGEDVAHVKYIEFIIASLPLHVVEALRPRVVEITSGPSQGLLTVAIVGAIWTASSGVEGLRTVLNRAYRVHTPPSYLLRRLMSIAQLIVLTLTIIIGMALLVLVPVAWGVLVHWLPLDWLPIGEYLANLGFIIGLLLLFLVVSALYYILPNVRQTWLSVFPGAAVTIIGWVIAARLFSFYLTYSGQVNVIYGSLGGIIAALLFFYIMGIIFIYGAELNYTLKHEAGERVQEKE